MITNTFFFLLFSHLFIIFEFIHFGEAVGGIAEMKALTGNFYPFIIHKKIFF